MSGGGTGMASKQGTAGDGSGCQMLSLEGKKGVEVTDEYRVVSRRV